MTAYDIYTRVLSISGHLNSGEETVEHQMILERMPDIINQICLDLKMPQIKGLSDEMNISSLQADALCYGTAMLLAVSESESEKNQLFTQIYNAKRAAVLSSKETVKDTFPSVNLWS